MRHPIAALACIMTAGAVVCAACVWVGEANNQSRDAARVCGSVVAARVASQLRGEPVFLTLDHAREGHDLTVVISGGTRAGPGSPEALIGRRICASGRVRRFLGEPRMLADSLTK